MSATVMLAVAVTPFPAVADCAPPPPIDVAIADAKTVLVGTVVGLGIDERFAHVAVESIWKGPQLPETVRVVGALDADPEVITSVDRYFQLGGRYIFVLGEVSDPFRDDGCSPTQPMTPAIESLAPADALAPLPASPEQPADSSRDGWVMPVVVGVPLIAALALAASVVIRRRRMDEIDGFRLDRSVDG